MNVYKCAICAIFQKEFFEIRHGNIWVDGTTMCLDHARDAVSRTYNTDLFKDLGKIPG